MSYAAKKLLDRYWDRRLPVDPFKLAKAWGARVEALEESAYNNDGLSGLAVIKKGVHRIYFDSSEHSNRQRFYCCTRVRSSCAGAYPGRRVPSG